ncbi:GNAT family N-acetyltransferase [Agromyces larvae]|uniref:GNAT family N-acetyltransferase n=1 Tax=Agromyces larvae TaxID=2929802 RepID=A0ABY4C193_9MICO|nr:GNAT family N-acetyltransferase [Agromyces larvae]UOE42550.1 GNAT family N-acetyltransferase [Agromyces larvae]
MSDPALEHLRTDRLRLDRPDGADLADLHDLHADPAVWEHLPSGRHTDLAQTRAMLAGIDAGWRDVGLDYWVARDPADGRLIGIGGCSRRGEWWNLYYRLDRRAWGDGFAQELARAAIGAARELDASVPIVAYLLEHNEGSRRVAERLGFELVSRGPDAGNPDPDAVRLVFADRPLAPETIERVLA